MCLFHNIYYYPRCDNEIFPKFPCAQHGKYNALLMADKIFHKPAAPLPRAELVYKTTF